MAQCEELRAMYIWARIVGVTNTWLVGVTIYCRIFQLQFTSTSPVFTRKNVFEKKIS